MSAILLAYQDHLDFGAHNLKPGSVDTNSHKLAPVMEFFGNLPLGALTKKMLKRYEIWRGRWCAGATRRFPRPRSVMRSPCFGGR